MCCLPCVSREWGCCSTAIVLLLHTGLTFTAPLLAMHTYAPVRQV